jgi:hypothetical protein
MDHLSPTPLPSLTKRLLWFVVLWLGGLATISLVGLTIKLALRA